MTREELIAYDRWLTENKWGSSEIITPEQAADLYLAKHPLPPAEGAEHDIESMRKCLHHYINVDEVNRYDMLVFGAMRDYADDFAAQQQPTAEGAEEILRKNCNTCYSRSTGEEEVWSSVSSVLIAMQDFATLHAQRIADKMVSERYEIAIKALETIHHAYYTEGESAEEQVVDLRSIALKALEEIDNLKTR